MYILRGELESIFPPWSGKRILQKGPGVWAYHLGALRYILRCDVALTGLVTGIWEDKEEPCKIADAGGKSLEEPEKRKL